MTPPTRSEARPTVVDLFCGAGGLSVAFANAGFEILVGVDADASALDTYRSSFVNKRSPSTQALQADVGDERTDAQVLAILGGRPLDVLVGGPPCQDFSRARRAEPVAARKRLVRDYIRVLRSLDPQMFVFENVPGLLTADGGKRWAELQASWADAGYLVHSSRLDAQFYGVPQRRERLFVVGGKPQCAQAFTWPPPTPGVAPTVEETIGHLPRLTAGERSTEDSSHFARAHTAHIVEYIATIPQGGSWRSASARSARTLDCHVGHSGHYDVYGRMNAKEVAPTITGGCTNPSRGRFIHPEQHRGITLREAALLQTFPADYHFCGGIEKASQQIGNAVPVKLGQALADAVKFAITPRPAVKPSSLCEGS